MSLTHSHNPQAGVYVPLACIASTSANGVQAADVTGLDGQPVDVDRLFVMIGMRLGGVFAIDDGRVGSEMIGSYLIIDERHIEGVSVFTDTNGTQQTVQIGQFDSRDAFFDALIEWHLSRNRSLKSANQQPSVLAN